MVLKKILKDYYVFEIILGLIFGYFAIQKVDLPPFDEALYQYLALNDNVSNSNWGPLYSKYLSIFFYFTKDTIFVNYANWFLISFIFVPFSVLILGRALGFDRRMQSIVFMATLTMDGNFPVDPKVQAFNFVCITLIGVALAENKNFILSSALASLSPLLVYVRQDNHIFIVFFFLLLFYNYRLIKNKTQLFKNFLILAAGLFACFLVFRQIGDPFGNGRTWLAFLDHHSLVNYAKYYLDCRAIADCRQKVFEGINSFPELLIKNPHLFFEHALRNANALPKILVDTVKLQPIFGMTYLPIFILLSLALIFSQKITVVKKAIYVFVLIVILKSISTSLIMSPFHKYLIEIAYILPLILVYLIYRLKIYINFKFNPNTAWLAAVLICISILQGIDQTPEFAFKSGELRVVKKLKELNLSQPEKLKVFSAIAAGFYYNGSAQNIVFGELEWYLQSPSKGKSFNDFLDQKQIDIVAITPSLHNASKYKEFTEALNNFIFDEGRPNFVMKFRSGKSFIFVRNTLVNTSPN